MYKILKSMLAEFSYFIEKHFGITFPDGWNKDDKDDKKDDKNNTGSGNTGTENNGKQKP